MLSGQEIFNRKIINNGESSGFRAVSYDVTVGVIIDSNGKEAGDTYKIPSGGVVEVITKERVEMPADLVGFAYIKTSLCDEGILPLNMGVIDPGYCGPLSTTLVNFSSQEYTIQIGSPFLRLSFNPIINPNSDTQAKKENSSSYLIAKKKKAAQYFGDYFLNADQFLEAVSDKIYTKYRNLFIVAIPIATLFIAAATYFATYYAAGLSFTEILWRDKLSSEKTVDKKIEILQTQIEKMNKKIDNLK